MTKRKQSKNARYVKDYRERLKAQGLVRTTYQPFVPIESKQEVEKIMKSAVEYWLSKNQ